MEYTYKPSVLRMKQKKKEINADLQTRINHLCVFGLVPF